MLKARLDPEVGGEGLSHIGDSASAVPDDLEEAKLDPETPRGTPRRIQETDDAYPVIAEISDSLRVINCRDDIQWIVQSRNGKTSGWRGRHYCRTRTSLIRITGNHPVVMALPEWHA